MFIFHIIRIIFSMWIFHNIRAIFHRFIPIHDGGSFWDVPGSFLTEYMGEVYLFCRGDFDDELDDYPPNYEVYILENISLKEAFERTIWYPYNYEDKVFIGEIPTCEVVFDSTRKKFVNTLVFDMIYDDLKIVQKA